MPTPDVVVNKMLDMAEVKPSDYVIDLGSGDGRIVIAAAKRGASGHGIEIDPKRIAEARKNARTSGVSDHVMFKQGDIFQADFSKASVITMYLLPEVNRKLSKSLLRQLKPGTRIVSHDFRMGDWKPDRTATVRHPSLENPHHVYYWVVPAWVEGRWSWSIGGRNLTLTLRQSFQEVEASLQDERGNSYRIGAVNLHGSRISIEAFWRGNVYIMSGRVNEDEINGTVQIQRRNGESILRNWTASRK